MTKEQGEKGPPRASICQELIGTCKLYSRFGQIVPTVCFQFRIQQTMFIAMSLFDVYQIHC